MSDRLWHVREEALSPGDIVAPGRWGSAVFARGQAHPFFYREALLELGRRVIAPDAVSRSSCSFAWPEFPQSQFAEGAEFVYEVEPAQEGLRSSRHDTLWLTWMGEANATDERVLSQCGGYWRGEASTHPCWEILVGGPLRVLQRVR